MKLLPDTLTGRTIAILLVGLGLFHAMSLWLYNAGFHTEIGYANERQLAERLVGMGQVIQAQPTSAREEIAHSLSGRTIEAHWGMASLVAVPSTDPAAISLKAHLTELTPELPAARLRIGVTHEGKAGATRHAIVVSLQLPDESWANFSIADLHNPTATWYGTLLATTAMAVGIVVVSVILVRTAAAPLRAVTQAARRLGSDVVGSPIDERGPREAREAAAAFNDMQRRITRLVESRMRTLAAVSHDLKTPLTRLRFRLEALDGHKTRESIAADLSEMEAMIDSTLAFLRSEAETEVVRMTDIVSLCATVCDDLFDQGYDVELARTEPAELPVRRLMLKRAIGNLVMNGVRYGKRARVAVENRPSQVAVIIDDEGPGIPPELMEDAFEPFKQLVGSRTERGGGVGLGLTVARAAARAHAGDVLLRNLPQGGLRAELLLSKLPLERIPQRLKIG